MKALILAAGFGIRLREVLHGRPKQLIAIHDKPFLRHVLEMLVKKGVTEVVIAVGYLAKYIKEEFHHGVEGLKLSFSEVDRPLGTAGSLKTAELFLKDDFLVLNGDTYLNIDYRQLLKEHQQSKALMTLVGTTEANHKEGGIIEADDQKVIDFQPKSLIKNKSKQFLHTGVYAMSTAIFSHIKTHTSVSLEKDLIPSLLKEKKSVHLFKTDQSFIDIDSPGELEKAKQHLQL